MYKVLLKDQYTSGYAKKIAGSYTLVAGFLIHQYMRQYTCCILKELGGILMLCGRYVYGILTFVAGFLIHQFMCQYTYCILMELGGILMLCGRYVYGILTFVAGFLIHHYTWPYTYCILHKAGRVLICPCTGFLLAWQDLFIITHDRINNVYCIRQEEYWCVVWKVRIQVRMLVVGLPFCHYTSQYTSRIL